MVKKGSLIGAIITTAGAALLSIMILQVTPESGVATSVGSFIRYSSFENFSLLGILRLIYLSGVLLFFLASIGTKKKSIYIGAIITLLGLLGGGLMYYLGYEDQNSGNFITYLYSLEYAITLFLQVIGVLIYYAGIVKHRKFFKVGLVTGFLVVAATITNLVYGLFVVPPLLEDLVISSWGVESREAVNAHFIVEMVQTIAIAINAIAFSFCKIGEVSDAEDEELSVEQGGAFASYVDESAGYTPSKPSYSGGDDIEFEF